MILYASLLNIILKAPKSTVTISVVAIEYQAIIVVSFVRSKVALTCLFESVYNTNLAILRIVCIFSTLVKSLPQPVRWIKFGLDSKNTSRRIFEELLFAKAFKFTWRASGVKLTSVKKNIASMNITAIMTGDFMKDDFKGIDVSPQACIHMYYIVLYHEEKFDFEVKNYDVPFRVILSVIFLPTILIFISTSSSTSTSSLL